MAAEGASEPGKQKKARQHYGHGIKRVVQEQDELLDAGDLHEKKGKTYAEKIGERLAFSADALLLFFPRPVKKKRKQDQHNTCCCRLQQSDDKNQISPLQKRNSPTAPQGKDLRKYPPFEKMKEIGTFVRSRGNVEFVAV